tara:strand:- start:919 stop:1455 length:537 start_codon:yes stop_codon:yes gene_type:complete
MIKLKDILNEDYSQRARNFRVILRQRLAAMKPGQKISYGKLFYVAKGNGNFKDSRGRTVPSQDVVQDFKHAVKPDIKTHRGARGADMVDAYLKFEDEATIKAIDITFTDRGRFYKVEVDGQRRVKGYDDLRSSEESLSSLLGYDISLRSMDDRILDKAIKDLKQKGIDLTYNDAMDVS